MPLKRMSWAMAPWLVCGSLTLFVFGCGQDDSTPADDPLSACASASDGVNVQGEKVIVCHQFHSEAPYVRVKAVSGEWVGDLNPTGQFSYWDKGVLKTVNLVAQDGSAMYCDLNPPSSPDSGGDGTSIGIGLITPPTTTAPAKNDCGDPLIDNMFYSQRRVYTLYKVKGSLNASGDSLKVQSIAPYLVAEAQAVDALMNRPFVGVANLKKANYNPDTDGILSYNPDVTTGVVMLPTKIDPPEHLFTITSAAGNLENSLPVVFKVANLTQAVTGANGECVPALTSFGALNPFVGASPDSRLAMRRWAGMHAPGSDTIYLGTQDSADVETGLWLALGSGSMAAEEIPVLFRPTTWMKSSIDLGTALAHSQHIHGTPNGLSLEIHPTAATSSLGSPCQVSPK